jgi:hypothetical protein
MPRALASIISDHLLHSEACAWLVFRVGACTGTSLSASAELKPRPSSRSIRSSPARTCDWPALSLEYNPPSPARKCASTPVFKGCLPSRRMCQTTTFRDRDDARAALCRGNSTKSGLRGSEIGVEDAFMATPLSLGISLRSLRPCHVMSRRSGFCLAPAAFSPGHCPPSRC